ncbi:MAG TPA: formyltransferase family protein [Herbaspirillum sp.]|jgi:methionyl-tRNA formyltransferase
MNSPRLVMLCARTARSVAYLQALANAGIVPDGVLVYGKKNSDVRSNRNLQVQSLHGVFCPDLTQTIDQCLARLGWPHQICEAESLDAADLNAAMTAMRPDLVIYSGYGGQLVPATLLRQYPMLHIHSGWLPQYRGSTTLYYQIIEQRQCAASALLLDEHIDTGPVLARKNYPMPPPGLDVDYLYDNAIRADLLVSVLANWRTAPHALRNDAHDFSQAQLPPYFIIHPLLKHLALLAVDKQENQS